jgi:hypothetical protein
LGNDVECQTLGFFSDIDNLFGFPGIKALKDQILGDTDSAPEMLSTKTIDDELAGALPLLTDRVECRVAS